MTGIFVTAGLKTQINNMNLIGNRNIYHIKSPVLSIKFSVQVKKKLAKCWVTKTAKDMLRESCKSLCE